MSPLPALDLHAHVETSIDPSELVALNAVVFAVTRSLDDARLALRRKDSATIWGVGCHPGLALPQRGFSPAAFSDLIDGTPLVGEVGLDGKSRVPMATQVSTLRSIFEVMKEKPRIATIHSYGARQEVLELVAAAKLPGLVLHWWLGTPEETAEAVRLGCYFSVNPAMSKQHHRLACLPLDRSLPETDHPFGDRRVGSRRQPGGTTAVESALAAVHHMSSSDVRVQMWRNLLSLVTETAVSRLMPAVVRGHLAAV